jgi:late competence development protein ComFB
VSFPIVLGKLKPTYFQIEMIHHKLGKNMKNEEYEVFGISVNTVKNKNESKVMQFMRELLPQFPDFDYCTICVQDVYALSLNQLVPRYVQAGTIVLKKDLKDEDYRDVVENSIEQVVKNKNHP